MKAAISGISAKRASRMRTCQISWTLDRGPRSGRHLVETSTLNVVNEAADLVPLGNERTGLDACLRLPHVRLQVSERLQRKGRPYACVAGNLLFDVIVLECQHPAVGVVYQDDLLGSAQAGGDGA